MLFSLLLFFIDSYLYQLYSEMADKDEDPLIVRVYHLKLV